MNPFWKKQTEGLQSFEEVQSYLSNIDNIGCGGCGISALAMYRWLKKHGQTTEQTAFYFLENNEDNHKNNQQYHTNKKVDLVAPCHVVLYHNDETIDCNGFKIISSYSYQLLEKSEKFLIKMINNVRSWNYTFDRKANVKNIANTLGINLSDVSLDRAY